MPPKEKKEKKPKEEKPKKPPKGPPPKRADGSGKKMVISSDSSLSRMGKSSGHSMSKENVDQEPPKSKRAAERARSNMERLSMLARPNARRLRSLWDEKCESLPPERRDKIKSALEEDYFLSPEQTEQYFQALNMSSKRWSPAGMVNRKEQAEKQRELEQRQKWLINFSAQVAYRLCEYIAKGQKEIMVSNRLRSIADVVLERVAEILGEPKPSRTHPGRLARFMVAISDRIAVWIENAVYRADALEMPEPTASDEHMRLDADKPLIC